MSSNSKSRKPNRVRSAVQQDVGWLQVSVNQPAPMYLAHCDGEFDRQSQKAAQIHWRAEKPVEWLAAWILKHQLGPTLIPNAGHWLSSPVRVQLATEIEF